MSLSKCTSSSPRAYWIIWMIIDRNIFVLGVILTTKISSPFNCSLWLDCASSLCRPFPVFIWRKFGLEILFVRILQFQMNIRYLKIVRWSLKIFFSPGGWLLVSAIACTLLNFLTEFYSTVLSFVIFLSANVSSNMIMAIAVNLYPTKYRGMATAFILMCGRIGGVGGSSIIGLMLNINCAVIFYLSSGVLISMNPFIDVGFPIWRMTISELWFQVAL